MALTATPIGGDPEVMLRCLIQEYASMGWGCEKILGLFRDPFYPVLQALLAAYGEEEIRSRVEKLLAETGVLRVEATVRETPPPCAEPDIVHISIPGRQGNNRAEGASHA